MCRRSSLPPSERERVFLKAADIMEGNLTRCLAIFEQTSSTYAFMDHRFEDLLIDESGSVKGKAIFEAHEPHHCVAVVISTSFEAFLIASFPFLVRYTYRERRQTPPTPRINTTLHAAHCHSYMYCFMLCGSRTCTSAPFRPCTPWRSFAQPGGRPDGCMERHFLTTSHTGCQW